MNQIQKISAQLFGLVILSLFLCLNSSQLVAQNQFRANQQGSVYNQWTPPNTQNANSRFTNNSNFAVQQSNYTTDESSSPLNASFPESALPFDAGVRTADFEAPTSADGGSLESNIDTAAATIGEWKDIAGEKASNWFGGLSAEGGWLNDVKTFFSDSGTSKVLGSLALVLGFYFLFVWVMRKLNPHGNAGLPSEVLEVLGQVPFGPKRSLQMVRLGPKLLLLLNSPDGTQPIGEITDPEEVEYLASLCQRKSVSRPSRRPVETRPTQKPLATTSVPSARPQNVGTTNLNDVIRILQQANNPNGQTTFEA